MKQIQWFPGHMQKARRQIEEKLPIIDIVYEIIDARVPESSRNPFLGEIIKGKPKLLILNKSDMADDVLTKKWIDYYESQGIPSLSVNSLTGNILNKVYTKTFEILKPLVKKEHDKGMASRPFRAMVIGIPNVGKSQFINNLAGKNKVKTGNLPGVTKNQSYIKTKSNLLLLDNPGVLWPKFESEKVGYNLALLGSIKDDILPLDDVAIYGIKFLIDKYPERLKNRYDILNLTDLTPVEIMDEIGVRRGCKLSGGYIDYDRVINLFLYDLRNLKLGKFTLETIEDV
ncbi:MAG: ribosome biogenesis GTPase YlqF [Sphaerochaetaceae bacterium]|nr:ribosome biogenesis GTPase YlqF [Sphaerochaetaceae bacterium]